jgi:hypothetical protein
MPEMHQSEPASAGMPPASFATVVEDDYALGCECANPMLQIERWQLESAPAGTDLS